MVPEYWNGEGKGYLIQYKARDERDFTEVMRVRNENANSYTFIGLEEWTEYDVRVAAFNEVGTSAFSTIATDRTIESGKSAVVRQVTSLSNQKTIWLSRHYF